MSEDPPSGPVDLAEFRVETRRPCADVVEILQDTLAMAEAGELRGVALAFATDDNSHATAFAPGDASEADLVFAIEALKLRLLTEG